VLIIVIIARVVHAPTADLIHVRALHQVGHEVDRAEEVDLAHALEGKQSIMSIDINISIITNTRAGLLNDH